MPPSLTSTTSTSTPEPIRAASRPAISLPSAVAASTTPAGAGGLGERRQHVDERGDQVVLGVVRLGDVDLRRAGGLQRVDERIGGARLADHDGGGLAQRAGGGDQFSGDLLQCTFGVLDEHKYFSHVSSMSFWVFSAVGG